MLLIKNGRVVDAVNNTDKIMDVLIDNGIIIKTGNHITDTLNEAEENNLEIIDAT